MLARSMPWRRACPDAVKRKTDESLQANIYILQQTGPTGFILKEEGASKKVKVFLGDPHMCSCTTFKKHHELCVHILWLLLKKFRIPQENPIIWQLGLVEREINEILHGHLKRHQPQKTSTTKTHDHTVIKRKEIDLADVCPICQDELLGTTQPLTFCKFGCGNSVHIKCMKIWAEHQKSTGEVIVRCPLCREDFGPLKDMPSDSSRRLRAEKASVHLGVACTHCHVCPIAGKCYKCSRCASYHLCHACFSSNQVHLLHPFEFRQHCNQPWRPAEHPAVASVPPSDSPALPPALINSLQSRSLTENDYELLLQLDGSSSSSLTYSSSHTTREGAWSNHESGRVPDSVINSFHVEPLHGNHPLIVGRDECHVCGGVYSRGDWVRKLPCKHKFHRECIDEWLHSNHTTCPIDGQPVYTPSPPHSSQNSGRQQRKKKRLLSRRRTQNEGRSKVIGPLTRAAMSSSNHHQSPLSTTNGVKGSGSVSGSNGEGQVGGIAVSGQGIGGLQRLNSNSTSGCGSSRRNSTPGSHRGGGDLIHSLKPLPAHVLLRQSRIHQARSIPPCSNTSDQSNEHTHSAPLLPKISNATSMCATTGGGRSNFRNNSGKSSLNSKRHLTVSMPSIDNQEGTTVCTFERESDSQSHTTYNGGGGSDKLGSLAPVCSGYVPTISNNGSPSHLRLQGGTHTAEFAMGLSEGERLGGGLPTVHFLYDVKSNGGSNSSRCDGTRSPTSCSSAGRLRKGSLVASGRGRRAAATTDTTDSTTTSSPSVLNSTLKVSSFKRCPLPPMATTSIVATSF